LDAGIFLSLFRSRRSVITAATMLAEIGDCRARYPTRDALAGDAGQAAVALESGKRKLACLRWACNKRLRDAFDLLADSSRHHNPRAADHYARASDAATTTPAPPALSAAPGAASYGAAGRPVPLRPGPPPRPCNSMSW
jgi:transposase